MSAMVPRLSGAMATQRPLESKTSESSHSLLFLFMYLLALSPVESICLSIKVYKNIFK